MNSQQFTDFCIMCGTDYNKNIHRIGGEKAYKLLKKYGTLDNIEMECKELDLSILNFKRVREIFSVPERKEVEHYDLQNKKPDIEEFKQFANQHNLRLDVSKLEILREMYEEN